MDVKELNIKSVAFNKAQYFQEEHPKKQIYLHHTAGNSNAEQVFKGWEADKTQVATFVAIGGNGQIVQGFSSKHWAYHLGLKQEVFTANKVPYQSIDKISIGIEVCNWGYLTEKGGKYYNYVNREIPLSEVTILDKPYKGYKYWHKYSDAQIESLRKLLLYLGETYKIDLTYNEDIWDVTKRALSGSNGVFTHNSVRKDKSDLYPCPRVIEMLKGLKK
jgi:N-acetyl-anhydromuramyl-L-alanine amidase AmpD